MYKKLLATMFAVILTVSSVEPMRRAFACATAATAVVVVCNPRQEVLAHLAKIQTHLEKIQSSLRIRENERDQTFCDSYCFARQGAAQPKHETHGPSTNDCNVVIYGVVPGPRMAGQHKKQRQARRGARGRELAMSQCEVYQEVADDSPATDEQIEQYQRIKEDFRKKVEEIFTAKTSKATSSRDYAKSGLAKRITVLRDQVKYLEQRIDATFKRSQKPGENLVQQYFNLWAMYISCTKQLCKAFTDAEWASLDQANRPRVTPSTAVRAGDWQDDERGEADALKQLERDLVEDLVEDYYQDEERFYEMVEELFAQRRLDDSLLLTLGERDEEVSAEVQSIMNHIVTQKIAQQINAEQRWLEADDEAFQELLCQSIISQIKQATINGEEAIADGLYRELRALDHDRFIKVFADNWDRELTDEEQMWESQKEVDKRMAQSGYQRKDGRTTSKNSAKTRRTERSVLEEYYNAQ